MDVLREQQSIFPAGREGSTGLDDSAILFIPDPCLSGTLFSEAVYRPQQAISTEVCNYTLTVWVGPLLIVGTATNTAFVLQRRTTV